MNTHNNRSVCGKFKKRLINAVKCLFDSSYGNRHSTTQPIPPTVPVPSDPYQTPSSTQLPNGEPDKTEPVSGDSSNGLTLQPGYRLHNGEYTITHEPGGCRPGFGNTYLAKDRRGS